MAEMLEGTGSLESTTIGIYRTAATVKGGRRFSFGALVVVGDRDGQVALGYGKAPGVPAAIEKAQKNAKKNLTRIVRHGRTISHEVTGRFGASVVKLIPASPGTGVIAGATVRAVLEMAGISDCLTKSYGSNNQKNLSKATMAGLLALRSKEQVAQLRQVDLPETVVDEKLARGSQFVMSSADADSPRARAAEKARAEREKARGKSGRGRTGRGRGRGRGRHEPEPAQAADEPSDASAPVVAEQTPAEPAPPAESAPPADDAQAQGQAEQ